MKKLCSMLALVALCGAAHANSCSWEHPGANPYRTSGEVDRALDDYSIADVTKELLRSRMKNHQYDEVVEISREEIRGKYGTYSGMRDMHFGAGKMCHGEVDRSQWKAGTTELGLVYCEFDTCVIVPTICDNVALVSRDMKQENEGSLGVVPDVVGTLPDELISTIDSLATSTSIPESVENVAPGGVFGPGTGTGGSTIGGGSPGGGSGSCGCITIPPPACPPPIITPPVSSVPEPGNIFMMLGAMLVFVVVAQARRVTMGNQDM